MAVMNVTDSGNAEFCNGFDTVEFVRASTQSLNKINIEANRDVGFWTSASLPWGKIRWSNETNIEHALMWMLWSRTLWNFKHISHLVSVSLSSTWSRGSTVRPYWWKTWYWSIFPLSSWKGRKSTRKRWLSSPSKCVSSALCLSVSGAMWSLCQI